MEIKQLKASLQLAQMRYESDSSEKNLDVLKAAHSAFQAAEATIAYAQAKVEAENQIDVLTKILNSSPKPESPKNQQVSGESESTGIPEGTTKSGDIADEPIITENDRKRADELLKLMDSSTDQALISAPPVTDEANEPVPTTEKEEKKTEDSPAPKE